MPAIPLNSGRLVNKQSVQFLSKVDATMRRVVNQIGPCELHPKRLPPFQSLVHAIIHQQLNGQAAGTIFRRFRTLCGNGRFPTPKAIIACGVQRMRSAGISRAKAQYILELANRAKDGRLPTLKECDQMTDQQLLENLTEIKGVGRWTAEMLLIFNLGRPDVLPVHDLGVRRGFQKAYRKKNLPDPDELDSIGTKWAPHRTTAALYFWQVADFDPAKKR